MPWIMTQQESKLREAEREEELRTQREERSRIQKERFIPMVKHKRRGATSCPPFRIIFPKPSRSNCQHLARSRVPTAAIPDGLPPVRWHWTREGRVGIGTVGTPAQAGCGDGDRKGGKEGAEPSHPPAVPPGELARFPGHRRGIYKYQDHFEQPSSFPWAGALPQHLLYPTGSRQTECVWSNRTKVATAINKAWAEDANGRCWQRGPMTSSEQLANPCNDNVTEVAARDLDDVWEHPRLPTSSQGALQRSSTSTQAWRPQNAQDYEGLPYVEKMRVFINPGAQSRGR